jgi:hypothetical protein
MACDAARQRVVLFGGFDGVADLGDTWVWDGAFWTQVAETGPTARRAHTMAYDAARRQVVLFGGMSDATSLDDTWIWDGTAWTQVAETGPSARAHHAMAGEDARQRIVLFGGVGANELGDTWEWNGASWTQRDEGGPAPRRGHVMAYDPVAARVFLFGGAAQAEILDDTWEWNGTQWTRVSEFGAPGGLDAAMSYDGRGTLLFGGVGSAAAGEPGRDDTWEWDGRFWTLVQRFGPPGRSGHAMVLDVARHRLVLHGGARASGPPNAAILLADTWECPAREPVLVSLTVAPATVAQGGTVALTVRLGGQSLDGVTVELKSTLAEQPANLGLPPTIVVPPGQSQASAMASLPFGATAGTYALTASVGGIVRGASFALEEIAPAGTLRIVAVQPFPAGDQTQTEEVHLRNLGPTPVTLAGWRIGNGQGAFWGLDNGDGSVAPGQVAIVTRQGRPMALTSFGGTLVLVNPGGETLDTQVYGPSTLGQIIRFD